MTSLSTYLMDSINTRMSATITNSLGDDGRIHPSLTQVDEGVQHPESVVILTEVETLLVEEIHSSVVTVKPG